MSGRLVSKPKTEHSCAPGWRWEPSGDGELYGVPPTSYEFPAGSVWACDCGRHWVSLGALDVCSPGFCDWRGERWWERRRRLRRSS